jgi:hypothetical protein
VQEGDPLGHPGLVDEIARGAMAQHHEAMIVAALKLRQNFDGIGGGRGIQNMQDFGAHGCGL